MMRRLAAGTIFALLVLCVPIHKVQAADPTLSITPSIYQLDLSKAGAQPSYQVVIRNLSSAAVDLTASSLDITGQTTAGNTVFSAPGTDTDHDIGSSLSYEPASFRLAGGVSQTVKVTINQPELLEAGGHYGAAVFTAGQDGSGGTVGVRQAVSSLLFLTTRSGGDRRIGEPTFTFPRFTWRLPTSTDIIIPNTGNTQLAPSGSLELSRHGRLIANGPVNPESNLILAGQSRLFKISICQFGGLQLAGRYQAELRLKASPLSPEQRFESELIYISPWFVAAAIGLMTSLILLAKVVRYIGLPKRLQK